MPEAIILWYSSNFHFAAMFAATAVWFIEYIITSGTFIHTHTQRCIPISNKLFPTARTWSHHPVYQKFHALIYAIHFANWIHSASKRLALSHGCVHFIQCECISQYGVCKIRWTRMLNLALDTGTQPETERRWDEESIKHYLFFDVTTKYRNELKLLVLFD